MSSPDAQTADIAVIGGSGFYSFIDQPVQVSVETPYGAPSAPVPLAPIPVARGDTFDYRITDRASGQSSTVVRASRDTVE